MRSSREHRFAVQAAELAKIRSFSEQRDAIDAALRAVESETLRRVLDAYDEKLNTKLCDEPIDYFEMEQLCASLKSTPPPADEGEA